MLFTEVADESSEGLADLRCLIHHFIEDRLVEELQAAIVRNVSTSRIEPFAIPRKWMNSFGLFQPRSSAIFAGIKAAAHRIWLVNPYCSSFGQSRVRR